MGRIVILEGPDGGGKTTLANELVERGFKYKHEGPPKDGIDLIAHYLDELWKSMLDNSDVVHDRLYLGETVYGPICRKFDRITAEGVRLFERLENSRVIHQYVCLPSFRVAQKNYAAKILEKDDYLKDVARWEKVYEAYFQHLMDPISTAQLYDYETDTVDFVLENLHCAPAPLPQGAIGSRHAKYLFIGDQPNHDYIDIPFFALSGSSGYLNRALRLASVRERDLCLYNANDCYGVEHTEFRQLLGQLPKLTHIIAMGSAARNFVRDNLTDAPLNYTFGYTHHPSYLKRFRGQNPEVMAQEIGEIIDGSSNSR